MAKEWAKAFYNSTAWHRCRDAYIEHRISVDGGVCEVCREKLGHIVHHIVMLTPENINDPAVTLNPDNLRWECKHCHDREEGHFIRQKKDSRDRGIFFDGNGDVIFVNPPRSDEK